MSVPKPMALRARFVFPVAGEPIEGGLITIVGERIVAVGRTSDAPVVDWDRGDDGASGHASDWGDDIAILPGLVNAHTHLELSALAAPLPADGGSMAHWIRAVLAHRQASDEPVQAVEPDAVLAGAARVAAGDRTAGRAIALGLRESLSAGVTSLGDIDTGGWRPDDRPACRVVAFRESIGLSPARIAAETAAARQYLTAKRAIDVSPGLSPHAPYTAHPELVDRLAALSGEYRVPLAMHLAESLEEIELLRDARGPLRELLVERGIWPEGLFGGRRPLDALRQLARAPRALVIHGNYLNEAEIDFLAEHRERMTLVICPRTHRHFGHARHPLERLLAAGASVAIGTDSRASSPDLSPLAEVQSLIKQGYHVSPRQLLEMVTKSGARALGLADAGALAPGNAADFAIVRLPAGQSAADPHELLCDPAARVVETWRRGCRLQHDHDR